MHFIVSTLSTHQNNNDKSKKSNRDSNKEQLKVRNSKKKEEEKDENENMENKCYSCVESGHESPLHPWKHKITNSDWVIKKATVNNMMSKEDNGGESNY